MWDAVIWGQMFLAVFHVLMKLLDLLRGVDTGVLGLNLSEGHRGEHLLLAGWFALFGVIVLHRRDSR